MTKEYIERMKAISTIRSYEFGHCPEYMQDWATKLKRAILQDIVDDVMEIPAADVVEIKHGTWEKRQAIIFDSELTGYRCSECKTTWDTETNYCPNCGARMDGGADNG